MTMIMAPGGQPSSVSVATYAPTVSTNSAVAKTTPSLPNEDKSSQAGPAKPTQSSPVKGFNPSLTIDPGTHIVVMTIDGPDGKVLRQIPNEHELAAYKANNSEAKSSSPKT